MRSLDKESFSTYLRERWVPGGIEVGEITEVPYKELVKVDGGFAFGVSLHRDGAKARAGVWFRPAPGGINDLRPLQNHYQQTLQRQNRFVRIKNCGTEFGTFLFFYETTQSMSQDAWQPWVALVEEATAAACDSEPLDEYLERFRA